MIVRGIAMLVALTALVGADDYPYLGRVAKSAPCQVKAPIMAHVETPKPWRWLGTCLGGHAEGIGVLVMGTSENSTFFTGRMHAGRPIAGMLDGSPGTIPVKAFSAAGVAIAPDGNHPNEQHGVFLLASRAALATSQWLAAHGNRAAAAYYRDRSKNILDGEPE